MGTATSAVGTPIAAERTMNEAHNKNTNTG